MGSVRRGLAAGSSVLAAVIAGPAWAEVCDKERPQWEPGTQANMWSEAIYLFSTPLGLLLLALSAIAVRWRLPWLGLGAILGWAGYVSLVAFGVGSVPDIRASAVVEGCIGSPTLFIVISTAICVMIVFRTKPRPWGETET